MADELRIGDRPSLERPVLITAFRGWNDGGQGASLAGAYLARLWEAEQFAELDPEEFFDFQANRPMVTLTDGLDRKLEWPENLFFHGEIAGAGRDAVLLLGVEPNLRWRQVTEAVSTDEETAAYVEELEQRADQLDEESLPSGESLAAELTRFLRERESGNGGDAARGKYLSAPRRKYGHAWPAANASHLGVLGRPRTVQVRGLPASLSCSVFARPVMTVLT